MKAWYHRHKNVLVLIAWIVGGWALWWGFLGAPERERNKLIDPVVFGALRSIEDRCAREETQTVRCQTALNAMVACLAKDPACWVGDYYDELFAAGFDLPRLYLESSKLAQSGSSE